MRGKLAYWAADVARRAAAVLSRPFHTQLRELSEHLRRLFAAHRVDCAFDIGAHRGKYRRFLRYEVGFAGLVVSVEPIAELAAGLAQQPRSIFLKLDTQGYDLEVLRGAGRSLESVVALQSEVPFQPIYAGMPDWRISIARITELGFSLAGLCAVSRDASLRLIEADCVFVRSR